MGKQKYERYMLGDATDMEHDTEDGLGGDATARKEEGPGGDAIDTEEQPEEILLTQNDHRMNNHTR